MLYIQLKKYMQLVCLAVDAKFRKDNIEATLHEAFMKVSLMNFTRKSWFFLKIKLKNN